MTSIQWAARQRYGSWCPCCGVRMQKNRGKWKKGRLPADAETRGHDVAVARYGDPSVWVFICWRCNNDQGDLSFEVWSRKLFREDDGRALAVLELAVFIRRHHRHGTPSAPAARAHLEIRRHDTLP